MPDLRREEILSINQRAWNKVAPLFYGGTVLPAYGPLAETENELNLIPDLSGKRVLEVGCGSGHNLASLSEKLLPTTFIVKAHKPIKLSNTNREP